MPATMVLGEGLAHIDLQDEQAVCLGMRLGREHLASTKFDLHEVVKLDGRLGLRLGLGLGLRLGQGCDAFRHLAEAREQGGLQA